MFEFYTKTYGGTAIPEAEFPELIARAEDQLAGLERSYRVTGDENMRSMALCAIAEVLDFYSAAQNGQGGLRYASVGTVSVSGRGIYAQLDISPETETKEIYRAACRYLDIYRGVKA